MDIKFNEPAGQYVEKSTRPDVPWFDNGDGKHGSGHYQITRLVFLMNSEKWLIETRAFKLTLAYEENPQAWEMLNACVGKSKAAYAVVNRLQVAFCDVDMSEEVPWSANFGEKAETYTCQLNLPDQVESQPKKPPGTARSPRQRWGMN